MFSVFSLAALHVTQNSFVYILKIIGAEMEEKLVQCVTYVAGATQHIALPNMGHCICACAVE